MSRRIKTGKGRSPEFTPDAEARFFSAAVGSGFHRLVLNWLRDNDIPLSEDLRHYIAEELESAWFKTPQARRLLRGKWRRKGAAMMLQLKIQFIAQRDGISESKAKEKIADSKGVTVEALDQALKPSSISGDNRRKK